MKRWLGLLVVVAMACALPIRAAEEPADKDKSESKDAKPKKLRLVKPWADITSLTDEQKAKISEIHADFIEKINQLRDEEEAAVMAILTDENKAELAKNEAERKQANKERAAARRAEKGGATTKPSDEGR